MLDNQNQLQQMRYFVRAFVLLFVLGFISANGLANPGDTTWVQVQNDVQPDWYNNFDTPVTAKHFIVEYSNSTTSKSFYSTKHKPSVHAAFYYYRLKLYYADGSWKYSNKVTLSPVASSEYAVDVRPNPFDEEIKVRITSPRPQTAGISIFDVQGRLLFSMNSSLNTGLNVITVDGRRFTTGLYTILIHSSEGQKVARKIVKL